MNSFDQRYVIARHAFGGIGDHISCLIGSWWFAKQTGRTLVIDWRGSRFNADPELKRNCFLDHFDIPTMLGEVNVIADDRVASLDWPLPIFPPKWTPAALATSSHLKHTAEEIHRVNELVNGGSDRPEPTVVINQWVSPHPPKESVRALLEALRPTATIRATADKFWNCHFESSDSVTAIHVRHGNGENIGARAAYWLSAAGLARQLYTNSRVDVHRSGLSGRFMDNMPESLVGKHEQRRAETRFYERIAADHEALRRSTGAHRALLFTDAPQVVRGLQALIPGLVACPSNLMPEGTGPLHQIDAAGVRQHDDGSIDNLGIDQRITREMFIELELMQRCSALLCMDSGFSIFAQRSLPDSHVRLLRPEALNVFVAKVMARLSPGY